MCVSENLSRTPFLQPAALSLAGCPLISGSWRDQTEDSNKPFCQGFQSPNERPTLLLLPRRTSQSTHRALDLCLFINGLPIATFELKNSLTKQTVEDAIEQYRRDRDPRERLFEFGRTVVH